MERVIAVIGDREWYISTGDAKMKVVMIVTEQYGRKTSKRWPYSIRAAIDMLDPFQYWEPQYSLSMAASALEERGHKSSSQELYRLNGPRIYTI